MLACAPALWACCWAAPEPPEARFAAAGFGRTEVRKKVTVGGENAASQLLGGDATRPGREAWAGLTGMEKRKGRKGNQGDVDGGLEERADQRESSLRREQAGRTWRNQ